MDAERAREFLRKLPFVEETIQWGDNLVFWVGDKAIGGKMFTVLNLDADGRAVMSFAAGPERFYELVENEGVSPAPYLARLHWVAIEHWGAISGKELESLLCAAHDLTYGKLPQRTRDFLALPSADLMELVAARKKLLTDRTRKKTAVKAAAASAKKAAKKKAAKKASRSR